MADSTYLNNVEVKHIHKSNARDVADKAREEVAWTCNWLLAHIAHHPTAKELTQLLLDARGYLDYIIEQSHKEWAAQYIIDNPDDCEDELEPNDAA